MILLDILIAVSDGKNTQQKKMKIVFTDRTSMTISDKFRQINWLLIFILTILVCIGCAMLYSAAGANWDPWALRQSIRFGFGLVILISVSLVDIRFD